MMTSRRRFAESTPSAAPPASPAPFTTPPHESAPAPRWGPLAAAILAALLTGAFVESELPTAEADTAQIQATPATGK